MAKKQIAGLGDIPNIGASPNYTPTPDPKVVIGKYGVPITEGDFINANKNGYAWKDFPAYADYVGGWARPIKNPTPISPYYRSYGGAPNINGGDIAILQSKYADMPHVQQILQRNIAPIGQIPMYSPEDSDAIRQMILQEKMAATKSNGK